MEKRAQSGIQSFGVALPRLRLPRAVIADAIGWANPGARAQAKGARAVCNWDEDSLTLAVEAARGCLASGHATARAPDTLWLASTTLPFADRDNAALVASALDLPASTATLTSSGSLRCGTSALSQAFADAESHEVLVVATDTRHARPGSAQELTFGHGAAAIRVGPVAPTSMAVVCARVSQQADFVDHYRAEGVDYDYALEERWVREEGYLKLVPSAVTEALASADIQASAITHFVVPAANPIARKLAASLGIAEKAVVDALHADCGETGAAHPLLMLAAALENAKPGDLLVVVGFGQGVDVIVLRAAAGISACNARPVAEALARRTEETSYTRYLSHEGALAVDFGMRAERDNRSAQSVAWRKHREINAFVGGRCTRCQTIQFPRFRVCVNPDCRATDTLEPYRLAETTGQVKSFTEDWQAFSARPPYVYGNVAFAEGGNLLMEFTDIAAGELTVGDPVRFVFRLKDIDRLRGFRRYFWKAIRG